MVNHTRRKRLFLLIILVGWGFHNGLNICTVKSIASFNGTLNQTNINWIKNKKQKSKIMKTFFHYIRNGQMTFVWFRSLKVILKWTALFTVYIIYGLSDKHNINMILVRIKSGHTTRITIIYTNFISYNEPLSMRFNFFSLFSIYFLNFQLLNQCYFFILSFVSINSDIFLSTLFWNFIRFFYYTI